MKFKEIQQKFNDVDSIQHGNEEVFCFLRSQKRLVEFDIKDLVYDEDSKSWYIEIEP